MVTLEQREASGFVRSICIGTCTVLSKYRGSRDHVSWIRPKRSYDSLDYYHIERKMYPTHALPRPARQPTLPVRGVSRTSNLLRTYYVLVLI